MRRRARRRLPSADTLHAPGGPLGINQADVSLLDVIDHVLNQGVVISGEITIGVADVDLICVQLQALVCSADRASSSGASVGRLATGRQHG